MSGVEPCPQSLRLSGGPFAERHYRLVRRLQTVIWNRQNCRQNLGFVLIENLDDVTVGL